MKVDEEFEFSAPLLYADQNIVDLIEHYLQMFCPDVYARLKLGFHRGHWVAAELPLLDIAEGTFLGRVTLYKLQTSMHRDIKDAICVIFCSGSFEGGEAIFPDLNIKFR